MREKIKNSKNIITFLVVFLSLSLQACVPSQNKIQSQISTVQVESEQITPPTYPIPHQALFRFTPSFEWPSNSSSMNIFGFWLVEIRKGCTAWNFNESVKMTIETNLTDQVVFFETNAVEAFDGSFYEFIFENGFLDSDRKITQGIAERDGDQFNVLAQIRKRISEEGSFETDDIISDLPVTAQFPIGHIRELIKTIQQGHYIVKSELFDGSNPEKTAISNAVIIPYNSSYLSLLKAGKKLTEKRQKLSHENNWKPHHRAIKQNVYKVFLSFYNNSQFLPDSQQKFILSDKGVILDMHLLINEIPVHAELIGFKLLDTDRQACK